MLRVGLHPAWVFNAASLTVELGGALLILLNRGVWIGAGALGVFTALTTLLAHRFLQLSGAQFTEQLHAFLEQWTICAAMVLVPVVSIRRSPPFQPTRHGGCDAFPANITFVSSSP